MTAMAKQFGSASAFKTALEARLRKRAQSMGVPFSTVQLKYVMERILARLFHDAAPSWLLKGGFAMDLRFRPRARTTKDIDLSVALTVEAGGPMSASMRDRLQAAVDVDPGDCLSFRIGAPKKELTNAPRGGARYPCEAVLVGKTYARFHIDIGVGDAVVDEPEALTGDDLLDFAGIPPARVLAIPKAQQFAEKLHAYTFPWAGRQNTRSKDLVDLVLLIERGIPDAGRIRAGLSATFSTRATHSLPKTLPSPPDSWAVDFRGMAEEANISTADVLLAFAVLERFWAENGFGQERP
jgi:Nucleotidyl transferase AbiEii toxin, Type IV TA system